MLENHRTYNNETIKATLQTRRWWYTKSTTLSSNNTTKTLKHGNLSKIRFR